MDKLISYLERQAIVIDRVQDNFIQIGGQTYELVTPQDGKLFDDHFHLIIDEPTPCDYYIFSFGGVWYYTPRGTEKNPELNRARHLGRKIETLTTASFLGIRGSHELLNGSGHYPEWAQKAKFLGVEVLGICEKNSLAGIMKFQNACKKKKIRPILGATYTVYRKEEDLKYDIKCYVKDETGWTNLLLMNTEVNVKNTRFIDEKRFFELTDGLFIVLDPKSIDYAEVPFIDFMEDLDELDVYYQLDSVIYEKEDRDKEYLLNLKKFVNSKMRPIAITDAFYIDSEDVYIKNLLNRISGTYEHSALNQYFKSKEEYYFELGELFKDDNRLTHFLTQAMANEAKLVAECQFQVIRKGNHIPAYVMTEAEQMQFATNEDLFWHLITTGLARKIPQNKWPEYLERIEIEAELIEYGHFVDYFLILWDIIKWSNDHGILTGIGRGSACGSLISYCMGITRLDPIEFDLLFERFLTRGRVDGGSMPDIDCDFAGSRRDEVKHYMEQRYGISQVFSVGTYLSLRLKSAIKDLSKIYNLDPGMINKVTAMLSSSLVHGAGFETFRLFLKATESKLVLQFIRENQELVNDLLLILNLPKGNSVHACATVILPSHKDMFHWIPVRNIPTKEGEMCLVSEWEGEDLENIGLLKEDILGILQLDKFELILKLIKQNHGIDVDIYNLRYDDELVFKYFRKGWVQDVFHFGAKALANYCKQMRPSEMNDLIAAIAIYRPGPIESNLHNDYILRKDGIKDVEYYWGTENITKDTYGIIIYQEQVMQICVQIGGFTLMEADTIRKALGKMRIDFSAPYKNQFIQGAINKGCDPAEAEEIWSLMSKFASYSFNKSHAAAYAATGYISQWLKAHYPIEFWTSAFEHLNNQDRDDDITQFISEINKTGDIKILPPDINESTLAVRSEHKTKRIYWALNSVYSVGGITVDQILNDRTSKGLYFSLDEFLDRHSFTGSKVNKTNVENLIYSGAFDGIEGITNPMERIRLLKFYWDKAKTKIDPTKDVFTLAGEKVYQEWWWCLQQKKLSGIAFFDYRSMVDQYIKSDARFMDQDQFQTVALEGQKYYSTGGYVVEVIERETKKKGKYCSIRLESNYEFLYITIFPDHYKKILADGLNLVNAQGSILLVTGMMKKDDFKKEHVMKIWDNSELILLST